MANVVGELESGRCATLPLKYVISVYLNLYKFATRSTAIQTMQLAAHTIQPFFNCSFASMLFYSNWNLINQKVLFDVKMWVQVTLGITLNNVTSPNNLLLN